MFVKVISVLLVVIGGFAVALQAIINGELSKKIGVIESSLITFAGGAFILALLTVFFGTGKLFIAATVPRWQLIGGVLGVIVMATIIVGVVKLGAAVTIFASIAGQLALSIVVDNYGLFGVIRVPFGWQRLLGILLMIAALVLILRSVPSGTST